MGRRITPSWYRTGWEATDTNIELEAVQAVVVSRGKWAFT